MDIDFAAIWDGIVRFFTDYGYAVIVVVAVALAIGIVVFISKHMPSKGRITDLYDKNGKRKDKKKKKG